MPSRSAAAATLAAFAAEAANLTEAMAAVAEVEFGRPTRCAPWTVRDLLAHVSGAVDRVVRMLGQPAPAQAEIDVAGYYRPDHRFSAAANDERVASAVATAARIGSGDRLVSHFSKTWREVHTRVAAEPADRVVLTRHGDAMLLGDFMVTRVVELAIHGLDLADALDRPPWLHDEAADVVTELLLPDGTQPVLETLGWNQLTLLRKATGRAGISDAERDRLHVAGTTWLALG